MWGEGGVRGLTVGGEEGGELEGAAVGEEVDEEFGGVGGWVCGCCGLEGGEEVMDCGRETTVLCACAVVETVERGAADDEDPRGRVVGLVIVDVFGDVDGLGGHPGEEQNELRRRGWCWVFGCCGTVGGWWFPEVDGWRELLQTGEGRGSGHVCLCLTRNRQLCSNKQLVWCDVLDSL